MGATRDCKHGQLARSCEVCELEAENEALRARRLPCREAELAQARYEKAEAERDKAQAAIQAKCTYCRESWDAGLDDPAFCPTDCPLYPYREGYAEAEADHE
jgi:hypothetical protein